VLVALLFPLRCIQLRSKELAVVEMDLMVLDMEMAAAAVQEQHLQHLL
jgi:hypothetical protein